MTQSLAKIIDGDRAVGWVSRALTELLADERDMNRLRSKSRRPKRRDRPTGIHSSEEALSR